MCLIHGKFIGAQLHKNPRGKFAQMRVSRTKVKTKLLKCHAMKVVVSSRCGVFELNENAQVWREKFESEDELRGRIRRT